MSDKYTDFGEMRKSTTTKTFEIPKCVAGGRMTMNSPAWDVDGHHVGPLGPVRGLIHLRGAPEDHHRPGAVLRVEHLLGRRGVGLLGRRAVGLLGRRGLRGV